MTEVNTAVTQAHNTGIVGQVSDRIAEMTASGSLNLPKNYSPYNALQLAWLALTQSKDEMLTTCTKASIANALLDMVIQGLNPAKKQCYFIKYGNQCTMQRSYMGTIAVAKRVVKGFDSVSAQVVHEGEEFLFETVGGSQRVTKHQQTLDSMNKPIVGVYAIMQDADGNVMDSLIMTMEDVKQSWKQSRVNPIDAQGNIKADSTHGKFTAEMAKRTAINRILKRHINASDDGSLVFESMNRQSMVQVEAEAVEEIDAAANTIDIEDMTIDAESGEVLTEQVPVADAPDF